MSRRTVGFCLIGLVVLMSLWDAEGHFSSWFYGASWDVPTRPHWEFWLHGSTTFRSWYAAQLFWTLFHCSVAIAAVTSAFLISPKARGK